MGLFFEEATKQRTLFKAWQKIKSNGLRSSLDETREAIELFDRDSIGNLRAIQKRLRSKSFSFEPQHGVTLGKSSGGKRGIVMASASNRIVERALLDTLQAKSKFVKSVNNQPTSVGGVPDRSVPHGLKLIDQAFSEGLIYFVRSDISGFFDGIPRDLVLEQIARQVHDAEFIDLLDQASTVVLGNEANLGEDRKIFPTGYDGVAQGSPLSPLFGNILLNQFDQQFNERGVICIRFIDDFVIMSNSEGKSRKAFLSAQKRLKELGLDCHDPFSGKASQEKAQHGNAQQGGFSFLGYDCIPGLFQPNKKARNSLIAKISDRIKVGKDAINTVRQRQNSFAARSRYSQTLTVIDSVLRGWGEAFAYGNNPQILNILDKQVDEQLTAFRAWYFRQYRSLNSQDRRRTTGVGLLCDVVPKSLKEAPFVLSPPKRMRQSKSAIIISTDGSTVGKSTKEKKRPVGAWAYKHHISEIEKTGFEFHTTNNRMELKAVIEALKSNSPNTPVIIRTDSRYVVNAVHNEHIVKNNHDLWEEFQEVSKGRTFKILWVKGHAGDPFNEAADSLARKTAESKLNEAKQPPR
ncbi:Ribonuclease HI [Pseudovibrio sp. Ad5]|uniref:RNase H family protein n=1 Tax=Pseudovibrio sp. Ad5 TaxID=989436 RepID=UPI0007AEA343|nr:RNase H family protein [Pseudovibrio sp. Ad5]KZK90912.1 Ribonuclease HI [Pseudovibrio sp. Ad5]